MALRSKVAERLEGNGIIATPIRSRGILKRLSLRGLCAEQRKH